MKALIFNSGIGKRMGEFTEHNHKSMAVLKNGETIFARQIRLLSACGIRDFIVTTGPFQEQLKQTAARPDFRGLRFTFVENPIYDKTNYIYSMYRARDLLDDDMILLHGDLVFNRRFVEEILADSRPNLGAVNMEKALPEKDFKARVVDGKIREVSIHIFDADCYAFQPFYKLDRATLSQWVRKVEEFIAQGNDQVYAENALNEISGQLDIEMFSYQGHFVDEVDNLEDLARVSEAIRAFDYAEQLIWTEPDSYRRIGELLQKSGARRPMLVVDAAYPHLFIHSYFEGLPIDCVLFDGFSPNPVYEEVKAGVDLFRQEGCDFLIAIGGGSAIDTAKNIKLFSVLDPEKNYLEQELQYSPVKLVALPTTAGTGSESTRFSVLYYQGVKQSITHDCIIPDVVILEPQFLYTLPEYQKKSTMMDAMCQCIEATWSVNTNKQCRKYAQKGLKKLLKYMMRYMNGDQACYGKIMKAANLSGRAINISQTTAAHAMSYKLSSMYHLPHGHAAALCLPHVWDYMIGRWQEEKAAYKAKGTPKEERSPAFRHLNKSFRLLREAFEVDSVEQACDRFKNIMAYLKLSAPELRAREDLETLAKSVNPVRLGNNPVPLTEEVLYHLYEKIFGAES